MSVYCDSKTPFTDSLIKRVYLELTKEEKIKRVRLLDLDLFIDDLPEILQMDGFLNKTKKILFDPNKKDPPRQVGICVNGSEDSSDP